MKFPKQAPEGPDGHAEAWFRLDDARQHEREMQAAHERSKETFGEPAAASALAAAGETTAAREAWVAWVERDY